ncbi:lantibiotic immunity ABC transporter MutG family permease subunit [Desemzia sp. RIT804]|uniref:lantibiotic immunity ABC transporter MutG family permease subunit n=1 Tax=Desemzia sp. RIT 804 TaxID=2810209 RepID=UPI00194FC4AE|nr:lantibiotic immunity ABC transporter MutG family permease subunit [Desemzia sp. RIT 804]MBM6615060.1 lantibiotic immunity ABC transporter MutG family permease subunit [Desemzia sp. RIT 804]
MKLLSSEWLKTKRTPIRWLTFFMPVVYATLIIGYIALRGAGQHTEMLTFQVFFEAWTSFVIPIGAGILSGFIVYQEELAGSFNGFLSSKTSRHSLYLGKLGILILTLAVSTFIALIVLGIGLQITLNVSIMWPIFIATVILIIIGTIPILALQLWTSFAWGMGASIGISIGGLLMAALMGATSLGDKVWQFIPWAWPVRLAKLPGAYLQFTPSMQVPPEAISSGFIFNQLVIGLIAVMTGLVIAVIGGIIWFNRWEGRKSHE